MKKKRSQTGWLRGVVTQGGGVEERPFSLHYDANCIQTPTYSAVSLTVKVSPDGQPGETHNAPSPSLLGNHKNLMSHAQNRLTFPSALQLATAYNRGNTISHRWTLPSLFLKTPVKTQFSFPFYPILQQFTAILINPVWFIGRCPCHSRAQINLIKPSVSLTGVAHANTKTCLVLRQRTKVK